MENRLNLISEKIIGSAFRVSNTLGIGFLEKVYHNALVIELQKEGLDVEKEKAITIYYQDTIVGEYFADILVDNEILVEVNAVQTLNEIHQAQLINYLKGTKLKLGLLINFGTSKVQIKRMLNDEIQR